jgi:hypothetical protein
MGPEPELSLADQVAGQAEFIVNTLQQTHYQYTANIDAGHGVYDCDCSQFANFVLSQTAPDHYAALVAAAGEPVPRAFDYYDFFSSLPSPAGDGWEQVTVLAGAARGDLIAWRFPPDQIKPGHDTGHVVFAASPPTVDDQGNFAVRVYDSAIVPHFGDTRGDGPGQWPSGVGSGFINFQAGDDGQPVAFQFSPPLSAPFTQLPIAIGRLA